MARLGKFLVKEANLAMTTVNDAEILLVLEDYARRLEWELDNLKDSQQNRQLSYTDTIVLDVYGTKLARVRAAIKKIQSSPTED